MSTNDFDYIISIMKSNIEQNEIGAKMLLAHADQMRIQVEVLQKLQQEKVEQEKENQRLLEEQRELKAKLQQLQGGYKVAAQTYGWETDDSK